MWAWIVAKLPLALGFASSSSHLLFLVGHYQHGTCSSGDPHLLSPCTLNIHPSVPIPKNLNLAGLRNLQACTTYILDNGASSEQSHEKAMSIVGAIHRINK